MTSDPYITPSPNLGLPIPDLNDPGPDYAENINSCLLLIDGTVAGVDGALPIDLSKQTTTNNISLNGYNLSNTRSIQFINQSAVLTGAQDVNALYVNNNVLGYNNNEGVFLPLLTASTIGSVSFTNFSARNISTSTTIPQTDTENLFNINSTSGPVVVTLPLASLLTPYRVYFFQDVGGVANTNNITIQVAVGSGNLIYLSSNAGASSVALTDQNIGGYIYTNGIAWYMQLFSTLTYNTETITFAGSSNLVVDTTLTFGEFASVVGDITLTSGYDLVVPSGAQIVLQSGSNLHADGTIALSTSSELDGYGLTQFQSGSQTTFLSGAALTIDNGCPVVINGTVANNNTFTSTGAIVAEAAVEISGQLAVNGGITSLGSPIFWSNPSVVNIAGGSGTHSTTFLSGQYNSPIIRVTRTNPITGTWTFIFPTYPTVPDGTTWMLDLNACMTPGTDTGSIEIVVGSLPNVLVYNNTSAPVYYYKNMFIVQVNKDAITTVVG